MPSWGEYELGLIAAGTGVHVIAARPKYPHAHGDPSDSYSVLDALVALPDDTVIAVSYAVTSDALGDPDACSDFALALAKRLDFGGRALERAGGTRDLGRFDVDVPPGFTITWRGGIDSRTEVLHALRPLGAPTSSLELHEDPYMDLKQHVPAYATPTSRAGAFYGFPVTWRGWAMERHAEARSTVNPTGEPLDQTSAIAIADGDPAMLSELERIASTVRVRPRRPEPPTSQLPELQLPTRRTEKSACSHWYPTAGIALLAGRLDADRAPFTSITATELYRTAPADLDAAAIAYFEQTLGLARDDLDVGKPGVGYGVTTLAARPKHLAADQPAALHLLVASPDRTLIAVDYTVTLGGSDDDRAECLGETAQLVRELRAGRALDYGGGHRALGSLEIDLPPGYAIFGESSDHVIHAVVPLGAPGGEIEVHERGELAAELAPPSDARSLERGGTLLGRSITWRGWQAGGEARVAASVALGAQQLYVVLSAHGDPALIDSLAHVASAFRRRGGAH